VKIRKKNTLCRKAGTWIKCKKEKRIK